jgi:uncharacterized protein YaiE (UPF0345 family)
MKVSMRILKEGVSGAVVCAAMVALAAPAIGVAQDAAEYSHVRIVRLSFAEGTVTVRRGGSTDWSTATANTPLEEGMKLSTGDDGFAEVEFENGSTARIGQLSTLVFTQLALMPSGGKVNHMTLERGYATFHVRPEGDDVYEVKAGGTVFTPDGKSEFRIDVDNSNLRAEVFRGAVGTLDASWSGSLAKNDVLELSPGTDQPFSLTYGITQDDWDKWVAERDSVQAQAGSGPAPAPGAGLYGWNDLYQYGDWNFVPGYGYGWFPDVAYGWAPYTMGRWAWYPSFGYTWIGAEPWGWLPYHCGGWLSDPTMGWFWMPGMGGCDNWSPALVTWYQGPGWTGWSPQPPRLRPVVGAPPRGGPRSGPPGGCKGTCIALVKNNIIQLGRPIQLEGYRGVNLAEERGEAVTKPGIEPTRLAKLPGAPATAAAITTATHWRQVAANGEPRPGAPQPHSFNTPAPAPSARWSGGAAGQAPTSRTGGGMTSGASARNSGFGSFSNSGRGTSGGGGSSHSGGGYGGGGGGGHVSSGGGGYSGGGGGGHASGGGGGGGGSSGAGGGHH